MSHTLVTDAWLTTDVYGEIRSSSRAARDLLGISRPGRHNLLLRFPGHIKTLVFDIEVALTGWPTERALPVRYGGGQSVVRYTVARRFDAEGLQLFWTVAAVPSEGLPRCA